MKHSSIFKIFLCLFLLSIDTVNCKLRNRSFVTLQKLYGHENSGVRAEINKVERHSTQYWRRGIREDHNFQIKYENHPFERKINSEHDNSNRFLLSEEVTTNGTIFKPMRIRFYTEALDRQRNENNNKEIDFIESEILPRTSNFWTKSLSVVPVKDNLIIQPGELANRRYCGDSEFTEVPSVHISDGIPDTDLVLYVSGRPSTRFCGPNTLAVAVACNFDQFDRPTAGAINFCLDQIKLGRDGTASDSVKEDNIDVAIHEAAHVLGMSSNSYKYFYDSETGKPRTERPFKTSTITCVDGIERTLTLPNENTMKFFVASNGQRYASIVTPRVRTVARNHFDCQTLEGAQLENQPTGAQSCTGDHWDERMFYPEALSGVISPTANILSPLTLALMEDSGWYMANYSQSRVSPWGHSVGCDFLTEPCLYSNGVTTRTIVPDYGKGFFCTDASLRGCAPSNLYKMACTVIDYGIYFNSNVPDVQFQYFPEEPNLGGPRQADYCPLYGSTYSGKEPNQLDCRDQNNADLINIYNEEYGENSMCFETTSGEGRCYKAQCILSEFLLKVNVRGEWLTCEKDFQRIPIKVGGGTIPSTLTCPRLSSACPDMFCLSNCAGRGVCNFTAVINGTKRPKCECFDKNDTSAACASSLLIDGKYLNDSTHLVSKVVENFFDPLVAVFVDHPDEWATVSWAWASGLFIIFLLLLLCICTSLWPSKSKR